MKSSCPSLTISPAGAGEEAAVGVVVALLVGHDIEDLHWPFLEVLFLPTMMEKADCVVFVTEAGGSSRGALVFHHFLDALLFCLVV